MTNHFKGARPDSAVIPWGCLRAPFLLLTPACLMVALATSMHVSDQINTLHAILVFSGALLGHISVNTYNEYQDFVSTLDEHTRRTPFSGGSGTLQQYPASAPMALAIARCSLGATACIGAYLAYTRGWALLPAGLIGLLLIRFYTTRVTRMPLLCLLAPGLAFGPLMILGSHYVLTGSYHSIALVASLIPLLLVSNLLLLNQFPDVTADQSVGRRHLPIVLGRQGSSLVYGGLLMSSYLVLGGSVWFGGLPQQALLAMLTLGLAIPTAIGVYRYAVDDNKLLPYLRLNVIISLTTPPLMAIGIFLSQTSPG